MRLERLLAIYQWPEAAAEGGFLAYGPRLLLAYRHAVGLIDKVLRGAHLSSSRISFDLVLNLKVAEEWEPFFQKLEALQGTTNLVAAMRGFEVISDRDAEGLARLSTCTVMKAADGLIPALAIDYLRGSSRFARLSPGFRHHATQTRNWCKSPVFRAMSNRGSGDSNAVARQAAKAHAHFFAGLLSSSTRDPVAASRASHGGLIATWAYNGSTQIRGLMLFRL